PCRPPGHVSPARRGEGMTGSPAAANPDHHWWPQPHTDQRPRPGTRRTAIPPGPQHNNPPAKPDKTSPLTDPTVSGMTCKVLHQSCNFGKHSARTAGAYRQLPDTAGRLDID